MRVLLIGLGLHGGSTAKLLARDKDVTELRLGDFNLEHAEKTKEKLNSDRIPISAIRVDASSVDSIAAAADGMDVIIDLAPGNFSETIMQGALRAKTNLVSASGRVDLYDFELELGKKPRYYDEFKKIGRTVLLNCGCSPGYVNALVNSYAKKMDTVESVEIAIAKKNTDVSDAEEMITPWNPGWSIEGYIYNTIAPSEQFLDGKLQLVEGHFAGLKAWEFPEPVGTMYCDYHNHGDPIGIAEALAPKGLKKCTLSYYVDRRSAAFVSLGLFSLEPIDVKGQKVVPADVIKALVPPTYANAFLEEDPAEFDYLDKHRFLAILVKMKGTKNGEEKTYDISFEDFCSRRRMEIYEKFGTSNITVALPLIAGVKSICLKDAEKGVIQPSSIDGDSFMDYMTDMGYEHNYREL